MKKQSVFAALAVLGLSAAMPATAAVVTSGTGVGTSITVTAGQIVSFSYDYVTADTGSNTTHNFSYYTFNGNAVLLAGANSAQNAALPASQKAVNPLTDFGSGLRQTGVSGIAPTTTNFNTFSFVAPTAGTFNFGVGVASVDTSSYAALLVDNIRVGGTLITVGLNNGSFENPDTDTPNHNQDLFPYSTAGNVGLVLSTQLGNINAPDGSLYAFLLNQTDGSLSTAPPAPEASLATATFTTPSQLDVIATQQSPTVTAVPLPVAAYMAPLGLVVAGLFAARTRRLAAV